MTAKQPSIVILTGAGISKESGLDTFRDKDGLWTRVNLEDVATPDGFRRNPTLVQDFYNARRATLLDPAIQPNAAHHALARLEREWPGAFTLVTQNIDDLHERAGSRALIPMHGELLKARCLACDGVTPWREAIRPDSDCPACGREGSLRPHVVWFGEMPLMLEAIHDALATCDLFVAIGTSGAVYPAAGFVQVVREHRRGLTMEINLERSDTARLFQERRYGPATVEVPRLVEELLAQV
jgi:NAD-dependent deacetylase